MLKKNSGSHGNRRSRYAMWQNRQAKSLRLRFCNRDQIQENCKVLDCNTYIVRKLHIAAYNVFSMKNYKTVSYLTGKFIHVMFTQYLHHHMPGSTLNSSNAGTVLDSKTDRVLRDSCLSSRYIEFWSILLKIVMGTVTAVVFSACGW